MAEITVFTGSSGLNTKVDPVRLSFDPDTGVQDLAVAYNVNHDITGRVSRRKGYEATDVAVSAHSLWCDGGDCFFVTGTSLTRLNQDFSTDVVTTVTENARVVYAQVTDKTYWMNGFEKGVIENGVNSDWVMGDYYGPETDRVLFDPPIGTILSYSAGRFYVGEGNMVWYSDPYDLNSFDLARAFFPFQSSVRMFRPVTGGFWAGDETTVYFIQGSPEEAQKIIKLDYPVLRYTDVLVEMEKIPAFESDGVGVIFATTKGFCLGLPTGQLFTLTHKKIDYPVALEGAAQVLGDKYITLLKP